MDYTEIKDKVIVVTHSLKLIPIPLLEGVLGRYGSLNDSDNSGILRDMRHPFIKVVVHAMQIILPTVRKPPNTYIYHSLCSVQVNNAPTIFFTAGGSHGQDYAYYQILDVCAYRQYVKYLMEMVMELVLVDLPATMPEITYQVRGMECGTCYTRNHYDCYRLKEDNSNTNLLAIIGDPSISQPPPPHPALPHW